LHAAALAGAWPHSARVPSTWGRAADRM
jgi:hypothetical protein